MDVKLVTGGEVAEDQGMRGRPGGHNDEGVWQEVQQVQAGRRGVAVPGARVSRAGAKGSGRGKHTGKKAASRVGRSTGGASAENGV